MSAEEYGYDPDLVPAVHCWYCEKPIGDEPYNEIAALARFGQMSFCHQQCDPGKGLINNTPCQEGAQ